MLGPATDRPFPTDTTTYTVQFSERGLPSGTSWGVTVNSQPKSALTGSVIQYQLPNGSYPYSITPIPGYHESTVPYSGPIYVQNATYIVPTLLWSQFTYPVAFSETGLPPTSSWGVTINGTLEFEPTGTSIVGEVPNGSFAYFISDFPGYHQVTLAYSGAGMVAGSGVTEPTLAFTRVTYTVTFTESGLPDGLSWSVTANGTTQTVLSGVAITSTLANGTYPYSIGGVAGYHQATLPYSGGQFVVFGGSFPEPTLAFLPFVYAVTFTESGLPSGVGTFWGVSINQSLYSSPAGVSIQLTLPNGTSAYTIADVPGYHQTTMSYSGTLTVSGASLNEPTLAFSSVTYSVTFTESGLPSGTQWTVTLEGVPQSSTSDTITFTEPNGTYSYAITPVSGHTVTGSGTVSVSGADAAVSIVFGAMAYAVTFQETGLPGGSWTVTINGIRVTTSVGTPITSSLPNGTYAYAIGDYAGYHQLTLGYSGTLVVSGAPLTEPTLMFLQVTYAVTFKESGLPGGSNWSVALDGILYSAAPGSSISAPLPNGTHTYVISDHGGYHQTTIGYSGTVMVAGVAVTEPTLQFTPTTFVVTFTQSGLPAGTGWSVNVAGTQYDSVAGTPITVSLMNGTYSYAIPDVPGYHQVTLPYAGSIVVSGAALPEPVLAFTPSEETCRRLALAWGVRPMLSEMAAGPEALVAMTERAVRACGFVRSGDLVILLVGSTTVPGATNMMKVHRVEGAAGG